MIEFHWKLQLRLLRDLVDKVRVSATSNVHVAEGICLPDFVLEVLGLGPKFAVQPQKNKPELVSIVRQVSKRVPEDQATRIINEDEKTCWCYEPRASKPLLQFHSAHTKLVKRGIAKMCLSEALKKSCRCLMNESFRQQVSRLSNAGYPKSLVVSVAEGLHRKVLEKRCEGMDRVRLFRAYLRAQMHRTYESYAAEIHFRKHLRLADQMIEFHWKLQLRLLRDLVDKVRVSATSNVHVAEGICLPDFVLEVLGLGPKFAVQPQKNKPELVSIVRQVSKRVPEDQATRIINEEGICLPDFVLEVLGLGPKFAVQPQKNKPELVSIVRQVSKRVPEDQATRIINEGDFNVPHTAWGYAITTKQSVRVHESVQQHDLLLLNDPVQLTRPTPYAKDTRTTQTLATPTRQNTRAKNAYAISVADAEGKGVASATLFSAEEGAEEAVINLATMSGKPARLLISSNLFAEYEDRTPTENFRLC
ncbi:hypothetical protein HPB51_011010 [Rhipicephalus microplus]|uniref:Endonuclease/exonuclease/phosphatase domain-containing protein n=1 Tax=Rhipicephalus microplus TaxID=6941 RepID=A0A9J6EPG9_RHIMP|nr:hypothetical protein HPB51_011010 [Rhipicephalus microplus]